MNRLRQQHGFTTMELLLACTIMLVILTATLNSLDGFNETTRVSADQNDSQQQARQTIGQLARELRNHAVANTESPEGIAVAGPYDLVFVTVGASKPSGSANTPNLQRVRYCLDGDSPARVWTQTQVWTTAATPPVPSTFGCPNSGWTTQRIMAQNVVNRFGTQERAVFTYDSATALQIRRVEMSLFIDTTPNRKPKETRLQSAVFLRNANHKPTASFSAYVTGNGMVVLNGTGSTDPEGEHVRYAWKIDGTSIPPTSETVEYPGLSSGSHQVELTVMDPGGLYDSTTQAVTIP